MIFKLDDCIEKYNV